MTSTKTMTEILSVLAKTTDTDVDVLTKAIGHLWTPSSLWGSKAAKDAAEKFIKEGKIKSESDIVPTGKDGKIKYVDVCNAAGVKVATKKNLGPFVSTKALNLAKEHNLTANTKKHFPRSKRSGKDKLGKKTKITLDDVRRVAGINLDGKVKIFASSKAEKLAKEHNIKPEDIKHPSGSKGKIRLNDVEDLIQEKEAEKESGSDEDSGVGSEEEESDNE